MATASKYTHTFQVKPDESKQTGERGVETHHLLCGALRGSSGKAGAGQQVAPAGGEVQKARGGTIWKCAPIVRTHRQTFVGPLSVFTRVPTTSGVPVAGTAVQHRALAALFSTHARGGGDLVCLETLVDIPQQELVLLPQLYTNMEAV
jgi:hypothetical protein